MAYATLEVLVGRVRGDLEKLFGTRRAPLNDSLRQLLLLLATAEVPEPLESLARSSEMRGLRSHLKTLADYLQRESRLPEALCARYKYKASESKATKRYRITSRSWDCVHRLAKEVGWFLDLHIPLITYENYDWHDQLEQELVSVEVVLDSRALDGMLMCALEGYLSPRKSRRKGYEVYGINLGMIRDVQRHTRGGVSITRYVSVMRSHPQLSAQSDGGLVEPNLASLDAILTASAAFYPHYQAVGDFHSHPYDDLAALVQQRGWEFSQGDEEANISLAQTMAELGHRVYVDFVIGIARSNQKVARRHFRGMKNTLQMPLGNCRIILAAYRSLASGALTRQNISLRLSGSTG